MQTSLDRMLQFNAIPLEYTVSNAHRIRVRRVQSIQTLVEIRVASALQSKQNRIRII